MRRSEPEELRYPGLPDVLRACGFPRWKKPLVRQCFSPRHVIFSAAGEAVPRGSWVIVWGMSPAPPGAERVLRLEDGFLRSVGLGADIIRPLSWVVDGEGLYYDATRPSELETFLATGDFSPEACVRAASLRQRIIALELTKYNLGGEEWARPTGYEQVILVPGQVESDASLAYGGAGIKTNLALLQAVRRENPGAFVVYKPHPDVVARMRRAGQDEMHCREWCDVVVTTGSLPSLLKAVDEVHVLTSLAGFEALLRGKKVVCHGLPFYAGWGLTQDVRTVARRNRSLSLDELVVGALLRYPLYLGRAGEGRLTAEEALDALVDWRTRSGNRVPWWWEGYRTVVRVFAGVR